MFKLFSRSEFKRLLFGSLFFIFIFVCFFATVLFFLYNSYANVVNSTVSGIIDNVHEFYPDVNEEDLIRIINSKSSDSYSDFSSVLEKYGYVSEFTPNFVYIDALQHSMNVGIFIQCFFLAFFGFLCLLIFLLFKKKEYKNIDELYMYFDDLNNRCYELNIADNRDDEFSKLRNELYKTTLLLKSSADASFEEKVNLSNSLADISHQLKTPITSIRILLDNICDNPNMDISTRNEFLQEISIQVDWISSLIVSLLKLAKIDAGVIVMNNDFVCITHLIDDVVSGLAVLLDLKNVHVVKNVPHDITIWADYKWIFEAFTNIIKNCIEHSYDDSDICIDVVDSSIFVKVVIRDFGHGIAKEDLKHIFERFYKGKNSGPDSVGIGLALAKSIVEKENGYICVDSELDKGTCFEIKFLKDFSSEKSL